MDRQQNVKVELHCGKFPVLFAELARQEWSRKQRIVRALKSSSVLLLLAVVALPVPVLHFVMTPACLLAVPIVGVYLYLKKSQLAPSGVCCPACGAQSMTLAAAENWPLWHICRSCQQHIRISKVTVHGV